MSLTSTVVRQNRPNRITEACARTLLALLKSRAVVVLIALVLLFSYLAPSFFTINNLAILTKHVAISAILGIGMTFVVLTGGIDLSVGSVAGLAGMLVGYLLTQGIAFGGEPYFLPVSLCVFVAILVCLGVGVLNGWLVSKAAAPSHLGA